MSFYTLDEPEVHDKAGEEVRLIAEVVDSLPPSIVGYEWSVENVGCWGSVVDGNASSVVLSSASCHGGSDAGRTM